MTNIKLILFFAFLFKAFSVNAVTVDINVDINTQANHSACDKYATRIRELASTYISSSDEQERSRLVERIKRQKKKLKRCEKKEHAWYNRAIQCVQGGTVAVGASF